MKKNNGSIILIIAFVILALALIGAGVYKLLKKDGGAKYMYQNGDSVMAPSPSPVSDSTDVVTLQKELDETTVVSVDQEFKDLNTSASSL